MKNVTILIGFLSLGFVLALALRSEVPVAERKSHDIYNPLKVELQANPMAVKFINASKKPLHILKPLDGSEWGWIMPHYKLTVLNKNGVEMPLLARCGIFGLYSNKVWPDDYMVTINAGESYRHRVLLLQEIPDEGFYTVRFEYRFTTENAAIPGLHKTHFPNSNGSVYPTNLWQGTATSNTIVTKLTKPR